MHGLKSTLVLLVALAGLVGYIYFVDSERTPGETEAKDKVFTLSPETIDEVQVRNVAGENARVQLVETKWQLLEPEKADADPVEVAAITSNLASLDVQRVVEDNPSDLTQYGLNPPRFDVGFRVKGQTDLQHLLIGEKTPTGGDLYAKRADQNRVFLISSSLDATFNKTAFDFRDKSVLRFDSAGVTGMELTRGNDVIRLTREGMDWRLAAPLKARADYPAIEGILTRLATGRMQRIAASEATDLRQYGLDRPAVRITLSGGEMPATLLIGSTGTDGVYAKDVSRPPVFTVEESLVADVRKELADFRRKDMFDSRSFTTTRIELRRGSETMTFEKTTADGKDTWRNAAGMTVDTTKVETMLTQLSSLRASSFDAATHPSLKMPTLTVTARFDDNRMETVTIARTDMEVHASRADDPGSARLDIAVFDEFVKALDQLK